MKKQTVMDMIKEAMDDVRDTYGSEVSDRNKKSIEDGSKALKLTEEENEYYSMLSEGEVLEEAEYQGRKVTLNKPMRGDVKKSKVYVKNAKGNVVKVNFGDPNMKIRKSNPKARKSFRARHKCKTPGPKWKARYWSCKAWQMKHLKENNETYLEHMKCALGISLLLLKSGTKCLIHAFVPPLFETGVSSKMDDIITLVKRNETIN